MQAEVAKSALAANGIESWVAADDAGGMRPHMLYLVNVQLKVRAADENQSKKILQVAE